MATRPHDKQYQAAMRGGRLQGRRNVRAWGRGGHAVPVKKIGSSIECFSFFVCWAQT